MSHSAPKALSTAKLNQVLEDLIEVRTGPAWSAFRQILPVLMYGAPGQIQALSDGDLSAFEKAGAPA